MSFFLTKHFEIPRILLYLLEQISKKIFNNE